LNAGSSSRLGEVIELWRFSEAERRRAVDALEPRPEAGGPQIGPFRVDAVALFLLIAGAGLYRPASTAEIGVLALLIGVLIALVRILAVLTGIARRRRLLRSVPEVVIAERGVVLFGETHRWSGGRLGSRPEGASVTEVDGIPFLKIAYSFISSRGSTQGERVSADMLVPVPPGQASDAGTVADRIGWQVGS
jgi:hypothetical protein